MALGKLLAWVVQNQILFTLAKLEKTFNFLFISLNAVVKAQIRYKPLVIDASYLFFLKLFIFVTFNNVCGDVKIKENNIFLGSITCLLLPEATKLKPTPRAIV